MSLKTLLYIPVLVILFNLLPVQAYNWPCEPFDQQHWINGDLR